MEGVRLILALHNHQPVGNFDGVFEAAFRTSYLPFLEVLEDYPDIPFVLHTSGPLLEWLVDRQPEYVERLRRLVQAGRVEILGGGYFEPILTMIPRGDRVDQIRSYSTYLEALFRTRIRGMWVPERVWEQPLVGDIAEAGIEYTVLDDFHFERAGLSSADLHGYFLTEDEGRLLKVFPGSERLRYLVPFQEPHVSYEFLREIAAAHPGATIVCADDGEKFGSWPETFEHVYQRGWLRRFCDMIRGNRDWLQATTFARTVDETLPLGKVYLPDGSYREMIEWSLPPERLRAYKAVQSELDRLPDGARIRSFVRPNGTWRNFRTKYAESDEMYTRMLGISQRLARQNDTADPDLVEAAREELHRGQCNCPYWHGSFGGLYLPHLRSAIYGHLISAHNLLDEAEGRTGARVSLEVADYNLDARKEIKLENESLIAFVRPALGGQIYELDVRDPAINLLATLERRYEPYHEEIRLHHASLTGNGDLKVKEEGLDRLLVYDRHPRKALVDHVFPVEVTLEELLGGGDVERGDFTTGAYLAEVERGAKGVTLTMHRPGWADGQMIQVTKTLKLAAGASRLEVHYVLEDLPADRPIHFGVEINIAGLAGHADDRIYRTIDGDRLGLLDARLALENTSGLTLADGWLDLAVTLRWSQAGGLWCHPIETVSRSEGGCEGVYQSSAVIPHWVIPPSPERRWELRLDWSIDRIEAGSEPRLPADLAAVASP